MRFAVAALSLALLGAFPAFAQDGTFTPEKGSTAPPPRGPSGRPEPSDQSGIAVETPKVDPKLIIDLFNQIRRPRPRPAPPVPAPAPTPAPLPAEPEAPVAAAPVPEPPSATVPPTPRPVPKPAPAAIPRDVQPPPAPVPQVPVEIVAPVVPAEPVIATAEPAAPLTPTPPAARPPAPQPKAAARAAERNSSLLSEGSWLVLALLAAAAAVAGAAAWSRARQIARTRAALSLESRLDPTEGSCSAARLAMACPPMSIRTRLEYGDA
jgi:hypothetical protein